jgi:hypothetical protein
MKLRSSYVVLGLFACLGCRDPIESLERLKMLVTVQPSVVTAASPVTVMVTIANISDEPVSFLPNNCPQSFEVWAVAGNLVGPEPVLCNAVGSEPVVLLPDAEWRMSYQWKGQGRGENLTAVQLPPGEYRIRAVLYPSCKCQNLRSDPVSVVVQ